MACRDHLNRVPARGHCALRLAWVLLLFPGWSAAAQTFLADITHLSVTGYTGFLVDTVPGMSGIQVDALHTFTTTTFTLFKHQYAAVFRLLDDRGTSVTILNELGQPATNYMSIWTVTLPLEIFQRSTEVEIVAGLKPVDRLDPAQRYQVEETLLYSPGVGRPFTPTGLVRQTPLRRYVHVSDLTETPPRFRANGVLSPLAFTKAYAVRTVAGKESFEAQVDFTSFRFDHVADPVTTNLFTLILAPVLRDLATGLPVPINVSARNVALPMPSHDAMTIAPATATISTRFSVAPASGTQLDSVNRNYALEVSATLLDPSGVSTPVDSGQTPSSRLLHFNGRLMFGALEGDLRAIAADPTLDSSNAPVSLGVTLFVRCRMAFQFRSVHEARSGRGRFRADGAAFGRAGPDAR